MSFFSFGREGERGEGTFGSRGASDACPLALFTEAALSLIYTVYASTKGCVAESGPISAAALTPRSHGLLSGPDDEGMGSSLSGRPRRFFLRVRYAVRGPMIDTGSHGWRSEYRTCIPTAVLTADSGRNIPRYTVWVFDGYSILTVLQV